MYVCMYVCMSSSYEAHSVASGFTEDGSLYTSQSCTASYGNSFTHTYYAYIHTYILYIHTVHFIYIHSHYRLTYILPLSHFIHK